MAEIKKTATKTVAKKTPVAKKTATKAPEVKIQKQTFIAKDLAKTMGISDFAFLVIKNESGLTDESLITSEELKELYDKIL